jgi:phenylpropionate dioxygenase-like ring-hydroxylating dioxygenase large terminal subunit
MTATFEGSQADEILAQLGAGLPHGDVPAVLFGNRDVYEREQLQIFGRCWVFVAHESEIRAKGDYVLRKIGEDNFVVVRDEDGEVHVLFDACRHRSVQICRADAGNTSHFRCPYHGWTYNTKGELIGAPLWKNAYGGMSKEDNGLLGAAQVDTYQGLIFATLDPTAPPLREYLGGMTWYLDLVFGLNEHGVEVLGPPQRFVVEGNWKSPAENSCGDDYHLGTLHRSAYDIGAFPVSFKDNMDGYHVQASPGQSLSFSIAPGDAPGPEFCGYPQRLIETFSTARISAEQLEIARRSRVVVGTVFPNFSFLTLPMTEDNETQEPTGILVIRTWQPAGEGKIAVWNWFCGYGNMTEEEKIRTRRAGLGTFSMGGVFEMDDAEPWITTSRTGRSVAADVLGMRLNYRMGMPEHAHASRVKDWPGPGISYWPRYEEGVLRNFYRFYHQMMTAPPGKWPSLTFPEQEKF